MILVSHRYPFTLITPPKNACTTMRYWFDCLERDALDEFRSGARPPKDIHDRVLWRYADRPRREGLTFCVVRNPWLRTISAYANKGATNRWLKRIGVKSLKGFLRFLTIEQLDLPRCNPHWRSQVSFLEGVSVDRFLHLENLQVEVREMMHLVGIPGEVTLPRFNATDQSRSAGSLHVTDAELIGRLYAQDVALGHYECPPELVGPEQSREDICLSQALLHLYFCRESIRCWGGLPLRAYRRLRQRFRVESSQVTRQSR